MKKATLVLSTVLMCSQIFGQTTKINPIATNTIDSTYYTSGWGNLNYSVPESPAFSILGTSPNNIVEPTSVRSVALSVGNYFLTSGSIIPKDLAVELSPLLLKNNINLKDYNKNLFLYRMRISFATSTNGNGTYNIAEGVRFTIFDKTDLRANTLFLKRLGDCAVIYQTNRDQAIRAYAKEHNKTLIEVHAIIDPDSKDSTPTSHSIDSIAAIPLTKAGIVPNFISNLRDSVKKKLWNAPIMEFGGAALQSSSDSLIKDIKSTSKVDVWWSWGIRITDNGQLLLGAKYQPYQDSTNTWRTNLYSGMRFYYGVNELKGYLQAQFEWLNNTPTEYWGLGCEFSLINGLWADFAFNVSVDQHGNVTMKPALNIRFGTPEKKK